MAGGQELEYSIRKPGVVLDELQGLMDQAGFGSPSESWGLHERAGLARTFLRAIREGHSQPSAEQRERLVRACQEIIEERKLAGELVDVTPPAESS